MARSKSAKAKGGDQGAEASGGARPGDALRLNLLVLISGAAFMSLEIAGSRLLAPHFGNSVFVWGSLITVFLAALSLGYFVGGIVADKHPSFLWLNGLLVLVAVLIGLIPWLAHPTCRMLVGMGLGEQTGPLAASLLLFLAPSVCMGMVSPFSVRLAARDLSTMGRAAGTLYAVSTLGSILGTLLTTFALIPHFGVSSIVRGQSLVMFLLPLGMYLSLKASKAPMAVTVLLAATCLALPSPPASGLRDGEVLVLDEDTPYHNISVVEYQDRVRMLKFDRYTEGGITIEPPFRSIFHYTDYFHLAWLLKPDAQSALFIGAGGGIGPRTFHSMNPDMHVEVVDIDERVLEIAVEHFEMPASLPTAAQDGRMFLFDQPRKYDIIVLDAFTIGGRIPFHLATSEYFELCKQHMSEDGVFVMNTNSSLAGEKGRIFSSIASTIHSVFPHVQAFPDSYARVREKSAPRAIVFVASNRKDTPSREDWLALLPLYPGGSYLSRPDLRSMIGDLYEAMPDLSDVPPMTDELAPIETMAF